MPLLKGKSSHGSNPMIMFSRTLSWMPHCWPQKQQCVFTSLSAGCVASFCQPPGGVKLKRGPNCSISASGERGGLAMCLLLQSQLRRSERFTLACRTEFLPVTSGTGHGVIEAKLRKDLLEIVHVHARSKSFATACAPRGFAFLSDPLVELDAKLRRALEDVEELSERQIQQARNHGDCVQHGDEVVESATKPDLRDSQRQTESAIPATTRNAAISRPWNMTSAGTEETGTRPT